MSTRMVRYRQPNARIILLTGYPELADVIAQVDDKVFTKPVELEAVLSEIRLQLAS